MYCLLYLLLQIKIFTMHKDDKLFQLKDLLSKLQESGSRKKDLLLQGQIIQILKSITYFKGQVQTYGAEVLNYYIYIIQPYILRAGMQIIDQTEEYVVMEGMVKGRKSDGNLGNVYSQGMIIDPTLQKSKPQLQRQSFTGTTQKDTKMVKIFRNSKQSKYFKYSQNLVKFEKEKLVKAREVQRAINSDQTYLYTKQKAKKFQFFHNLGSCDLNQLIIQSKLVVANKCSILHYNGTEVTRLGFILSGQVKLDNSASLDKQKQFQAGKLIIQKYMVHKRQRSSSVVSFSGAGEWIGLEEYLWNQNFLSKAQVHSHDVQILYVPISVFNLKFNELTNFHLMHKIKGLIYTKKKLLDKAIKTKQDKTIQVQFQKKKSQALAKIQQRIKKNQIEGLQQKSNQNTQYFSLRKKSNTTNTNTDLKNVTANYTIPQKCYMPQRLLHKVKIFQQKYESLPKIQQRFVLFPQQYQRASIPLDLKQKMRVFKKSRKQQNTKQERSFRVLSNEKIYERIIFQSLGSKQQNPQLQKCVRLPKNRSKGSIQLSDLNTLQNCDQFQSIVSQTSSKNFRFNNSIFNNFRAPRNRGQRLLQNLYKTLQII